MMTWVIFDVMQALGVEKETADGTPPRWSDERATRLWNRIEK